MDYQLNYSYQMKENELRDFFTILKSNESYRNHILPMLVLTLPFLFSEDANAAVSRDIPTVV